MKFIVHIHNFALQINDLIVTNQEQISSRYIQCENAS